ncbi:MAG: DUF599 domain-containing protein [Thalassotalea sp.]
MPFHFLDSLALIIFITSWMGYSSFAWRKAQTTPCIARCLQQHRIHWINELITRDIRVSEAALLGNLERNIAFFASSTLLIIAGILTLFSQVDALEDVIRSIPNSDFYGHSVIQLKLALMAFIFVVAFFNFTWSMRQYGFVNVMIGAAPVDESGTNENLKRYAFQIATIQDKAAHSYNYGLRAYYFSLAVLCWFYHPILFILASIIVVGTLYMREFKSTAVKALMKGQEFLTIEREKRFPTKG